jgi:hypothetical protein
LPDAPPVAETAKSASPKVLSARGPKLIVWPSLEATIVRTTSSAGLKLAFPDCEAVNVQAPVPLVIVTVLPEIVQTPDAETPTARPELAVALTGKVELYGAGEAGWSNVIVWFAVAGGEYVAV